MILEGLLTLVLSLFSFLFGLFPTIPSFPDEVTSVIDGVLPYLTFGVEFLHVFCYTSVLVVMMEISVSLFLLYELYQLIMWVIRKIPLFGIE